VLLLFKGAFDAFLLAYGPEKSNRFLSNLLDWKNLSRSASKWEERFGSMDASMEVSFFICFILNWPSEYGMGEGIVIYSIEEKIKDVRCCCFVSPKNTLIYIAFESRYYSPPRGLLFTRLLMFFILKFYNIFFLPQFYLNLLFLNFPLESTYLFVFSLPPKPWFIFPSIN